MNSPSLASQWRVCVTRDEPAHGPLCTALLSQHLQPALCPVLVEAPPGDPQALAEAARHLERYSWVVCASARSVGALTRVRGARWPASLGAAAVGAATARAITEAGVAAPPVTAAGDGAETLWAALASAAVWPRERVLVPTTPGGGRTLIEHLAEAGAVVDEVEAYRMTARAADAIARDWADASPDAVIVASARVAEVLARVVGAGPLIALQQVVALGQTTAAALAQLGIPCVVPARADFGAAARLLAASRAGAPTP